jgi:hypothetical protein
MKKLIPVLLMGLMLATSGCNQSKPGGPGAALPDSEQATIGQTDNAFSLDAPMTSTNIGQGEVKEIALGIKRGNNFDQDVSLAFSDVPAGLTITPASASLGKEDSEAKLSLSAAPDAAIGDFTIKVTGHPGMGENATTDLKVTVDKK